MIEWQDPGGLSGGSSIEGTGTARCWCVIVWSGSGGEPGNDAGSGAQGSGRVVRGLSPPTQALREAGLPPATVRNSGRRINKRIRAELEKLGRRYIRVGKELTVEDQEAMVRGRLLENVMIGTDKGVMAAKQLGADKRVAMWQPGSTRSLIVLSPPPVQQLDHKVPLLPSKHPEDLE